MARRLFLSFLLVVFIAVFATFLAMTTVISYTFDNYRNIHLDAHFHHIPRELLSYYRQHDSWIGIEETIDNLSRLMNVDVALIDAEQSLITATSTEVRAIAQAQDPQMADFVMPLQQGTPAELIGTVYFKSSSLLRQRDNEFLRRLSLTTLGVGLFVVLIASVVSYAIARSFSRPIVQMGEAAKRVAQADYDIEVHIQQSDEIGLLAQAFNQMAAEIGKLEKVRRNLVLNVSHDLRTPLTIVRGYLEGLQLGQIIERRAAEKAFDVMYREVKNLIALIDSLNDVAALDSGEIPLKPTWVSPHYLVNRAIERIQPSADAHDVVIKPLLTDTGDVNGEQIQVDYDKIGQVLYNLLDNAVSYSGKGGWVQIGSHVEKDDAGQTQVVFIVQDNGEGVPPEHQPFIFERFYRADQARNRTQSGYGMGLSIVRSIVHAHGGRVDVRSSGVVGEETTFTVRIPVQFQVATFRRYM